MTYRGHVRNGQITLDEPVQIPEGAEVTVAWIEPAGQNGEDLNQILLKHAGRGRDLPSDLAEHRDHYAHGKPKP